MERRSRSAEGRDNRLGHRLLCRRRERRPLLLRNRAQLGGAFRQGCDQHILVRLAAQEPIELGDGRGQNKVWREETALRSLPGLRDPFVDLRRDKLQPYKIVFNISPVADRMRLAQEIDQMHLQPTKLLEDKAKIFERFRADNVIKLPRQHSPGYALRRC